ncbi:hypothetical protein ACIA6T_34495 [Streptomyces sp. NPDC051740]|uniref:hypothetical protein n=1 Tax=Streptomyces sp. NPDC051740 TaxID=3365673 RepID=UPI003790339E
MLVHPSSIDVGIATVHRCVREAAGLLVAPAPTLEQMMRTGRKKTYVILDGTALPIDRVAADRPYHSGKKKHHVMNTRIRPAVRSGPRTNSPEPCTI